MRPRMTAVEGKIRVASNQTSAQSRFAVPKSRLSVRGLFRRLARGLRPAVALALLSVFCLVQQADAYSVLSHEEVVDMAWQNRIVPLLLARFPDTNAEGLVTAHAYAYGGCVIQDIGYYPFGSHLFSDLLHYVRTGDFVSALLRDATDVNEYAFALGALAHYASDIHGHPFINEITPQEYPKLRGVFGRLVTYDDDPIAHLRTEFGFDVVEVARGRYSQENYRSFIGFQVSKPLLERAFQETYGFDVKQIMPYEDLAITSYRRSISSLIPKMTHVALAKYGKQIKAETPNFDRKEFLYRFDRTEFEKTYGKEYLKPSRKARFVAFLLGLLPKVGPLADLRLHMPNAKEQDLYLKSMNDTVDSYDTLLDQMKSPEAELHGPDLPDTDLDTGKQTASGEYRLADLSYATLLEKLVAHPGVPISMQLRDHLLFYYAEPTPPRTLNPNAKGERHAKDWTPADWPKVEADVELLRLATLMPPPPQEPAVLPPGTQTMPAAEKLDKPGE